MSEPNQNKWAIITGALGGIGQALVQEFSNNGYNVIAADIKKYDNSFSDLNRVEFVELDLKQITLSEEYSNQCYLKVQELTHEQGIEALVNNAAVQSLAHTKDMTRTRWQSTFNVNLSAPMFLSQLFLGDLTKNSGSIVNISSIHATQTKKEFVAYATSKAALSSLTRNMVLDIGDKVRVNAIEPAAIATNMLKAGFEGKAEQFKELEMFHPLGRVGLPSEVAKLAVYLCSEYAGFVQGACISASGGIQGCLSDPK